MGAEYYAGREENAERLALCGPILAARMRPTSFVHDIQVEQGIDRPPHDVHLLVDTGAAITCVDVAVLESLGLQPVDYTTLYGVNRRADRYPVYRCVLDMPLERKGGKSRMAPFQIVVAGLPQHAGAGPNHNGLLGRDFLKRFRFAYDGPSGRFVIFVPGNLALEPG